MKNRKDRTDDTLSYQPLNRPRATTLTTPRMHNIHQPPHNQSATLKRPGTTSQRPHDTQVAHLRLPIKKLKHSQQPSPHTLTPHPPNPTPHRASPSGPTPRSPTPRSPVPRSPVPWSPVPWSPVPWSPVPHSPAFWSLGSRRLACRRAAPRRVALPRLKRWQDRLGGRR